MSQKFKIISLLVILVAVSACTQQIGLKATRIYSNAHTGGSAIAFNTNSSLLASGGWAGYVNVWRLDNGKRIDRWKAHDDSVNGLVFINNNQALLTASFDKTIRIWNLHKQLLKEKKFDSPITSVAVNRAKNWLFTGHKDGSVRIINIGTLDVVHKFAIHKKQILGLTFSPKHQLIGSSSSDGRVALTRLNGKIRYLKSPPSDARTLQFIDRRDELVGGGWFNLFTWNVNTGRFQVIRTKHRGIIRDIELSADKKVLATISRQTDSSIYLLDPDTKKIIRQLAPHKLCGRAVIVSNDGHYVASTSDDASVRLYNLKTPIHKKAEN